MDWDNDYYTFSDTNIEYIWRFLKTVHERGWLYRGHRSTQWCPRCGTSLSQHEQAGEENYKELDHPSLYVRFPLKDREGESLVVWTTTPWTLPANVAAAVKPDAEYGLRDGGWTLAVTDEEYDHVAQRAKSSSASSTKGRSTTSRHRRALRTGSLPWDDVSLTEGTGIVHIAPGAGTEDFELSAPARPPGDRAHRRVGADGVGLRCARRALDRRGRGRRSSRICASATCSSRPAGSPTGIPSAGAARHRSSSASSTTGSSRPTRSGSRCSTPNATVEWTPGLLLEADGRLAAEHGRLEHLAQAVLRPAAALLPVRVRPPDRDRLARRARARGRCAGLDGLQELHRPWIDDVVISCEACGEEVTRIPEVGDAWLDAGIVPLSTLGWDNERGSMPGGYATGAAKGLTTADLPDHAYWEQWFPPTGSRRAASRSGSGSTRCRSCRSR